MIEYISLAISSLKAAKDITSSLIELRDFDKITTATIELKGLILQTMDHIISEKERVSELQAKIDELQKELNRLKEWDSEKQKYSLRQIANGNFVYVLNDFSGTFNNAEKLCPNCYNKTHKSLLQQRYVRKEIQYISLVCPNGCPELLFDHYINS